MIDVRFVLEIPHMMEGLKGWVRGRIKVMKCEIRSGYEDGDGGENKILKIHRAYMRQDLV